MTEVAYDDSKKEKQFKRRVSCQLLLLKKKQLLNEQACI